MSSVAFNPYLSSDGEERFRTCHQLNLEASLTIQGQRPHACPLGWSPDEDDTFSNGHIAMTMGKVQKSKEMKFRRVERVNPQVETLRAFPSPRSHPLCIHIGAC